MRRRGCVVLDGEAPEDCGRRLPHGLARKGETADELEGAVRAVRERMTRWEAGVARDRLLDTCGTGGDGAGTVNISTAAAIVAAACGVPVVKHGNRAATSRTGSSDVLAALGVAIDPEPDVSRSVPGRAVPRVPVRPGFHPGLARLAPVRRQLPFRTIFNLVGPLCNPASPRYQLIGVPNELHAELVAQVLARQAHIAARRRRHRQRRARRDHARWTDQVRVVEAGRVEQRAYGSRRTSGWPPERRSHSGSRRPRKARTGLTRVFEGERGRCATTCSPTPRRRSGSTGDARCSKGARLAAAAIDSGDVESLLERWRSGSRPVRSASNVRQPCPRRDRAIAAAAGHRSRLNRSIQRSW